MAHDYDDDAIKRFRIIPLHEHERHLFIRAAAIMYTELADIYRRMNDYKTNSKLDKFPIIAIMQKLSWLIS